MPGYTCILIQDITKKYRPNGIIDSLTMCIGRQMSDNNFVYIIIFHQVVWYLIKEYMYLCVMLLISGMSRKHLECFRM